MPTRRDSTAAPVVADELVAPVGTGVELYYQTFGDPSDEPLVLVMGLGGPMNWWDTELCVMLAEAGFYVVRYDNRDTGRSTRIPGRVKRSHLVRAFGGAKVRAPYSMSDLADDAVALMDHLGLESAHLAGISMGGMIAQTVAIEHPKRVRSLTSIMSTTGKRSVGWQDPRLIPALLAPRKPGRESYVSTSVAFWDVIGSPGYPADRERLTARAGETFDRGYSASGVMRHMMAVLQQPDRTHRLRSLRIPALVVHGLNDKMVHVSGGRSTAAAIPGAELVLVDGMGHDLPPALFETLVEAISRTADRA
ncbi:alpha/beta fold hydrolase [Nocardioides KLBMP 9356]|uniref:Alpha/beta fold hydrolase n=1 Tax=Nocardioides potassii TaxID=2911371 RepID=A0ABS9H5W3_9ACTN|nr:alpha/beta fold hydrolase [Nocardioides potassii]MCF6376637.1 alpha/beta fold hydrolase [Nocardioides potassii]